MQRIFARARRIQESPQETLDILASLKLSQVQLLQGAGGVGKSVLLTALQKCVQHEHLGQMVITAWTGVAAAPFATKTLCSLLKLDFTKLNKEKIMDQSKIAAMRAEFAQIICDPDDLVSLVIDEISFIVPEVLH